MIASAPGTSPTCCAIPSTLRLKASRLDVRAREARAPLCYSTSGQHHMHRQTKKEDKNGSLASRVFNVGLSIFTAVSLSITSPLPSQAVLSSPNAQIARSPDAALRRSIPVFNPAVEKLQKSMEEVAYLLRIPQRKPWGNMAAAVSTALAAFDSREQLLDGVSPANEQAARELLDQTFSRVKQLEQAVKSQQPDAVSIRAADVLKYISQLELLQAPGLQFQIPKDYQTMPRLIGRAVVNLTIEKKDSSLAFSDEKNGGLTKQGTVELTIDGYSAPISAGNFVVNVLDGLYDGRSIQASPGSVIVPGASESSRKPIPLEVLPIGEFDPLYRSPLDVLSGELPVLPLSINGAISMTHIPGTDSYLSGDEWFVYKFDKQQAGLAGLSFDEGSFGVFGYVTKGMDVISKLQSGDKIVQAKVVSGAERLIKPSL